MAEIDSIEVFRKGREDRVRLVTNDGRMHDFDAELAVKFRWARGLVFNEDQWAQWMAEQGRLVARRALLGQLSLRKKSAAEARQWLESKGHTPDAAIVAVEDALERGCLDDKSYAAGIIKRRSKATPGTLALQHELETRGIDPQIADDLLAPMGDHAGQKSQALRIAEAKVSSLKALPPQKAAQRLAGHLARKGFTPEVVAEVVEELIDLPDGEVSG